MKTKLTLIKLGGALITDKNHEDALRPEILARLMREIKAAKARVKINLILGNGAGSFGHITAKKFQTSLGFINDKSRLGMALTQDGVARLNRIVVEAGLKLELPMSTLAPSGMLVANDRKAISFCDKVLLEYLKLGIIPVVYGDVISDVNRGCTIWSTDKVFSFLSSELLKHDFEIDKIIHVTEAQGVWKNEKHEIYPRIDESMRAEVKEKMMDINGVDVTGGMWHKIEESLFLAKNGVETRIISGLVPGALFEVLTGNQTIGTRII